MNRRSVLSAVGIGITTAIAGCIEGEQAEATGEETLANDDNRELQEENIEDIYDERVENGELVHGHNLNITSIEQISDDSVTLEATMSINPENDYTVNLHYNPLTPNENGQWDMNHM